MAWWVKVLAVKPDGLNSIPGTQMVKERTDVTKLPSDLHKHAAAHIHQINNIN